MKPLTVSQLKSQRTGFRLEEPQPAVGSQTRIVYDLFKNNPGKIVTFNSCKEYAIISRLIDRYGLDIRSFGKCRWCLVGEWFGKHYQDYLADHELLR